MRTESIIGFILFISFNCLSWGQDVTNFNKEAARLIEEEDFNQAKKVLTDALNLQEVVVNDNSTYAETLHYLGKWYYITGNYMMADSLLKRSLTIRKEISDTLSAEYAETLHYLGRISLETSNPFLNKKARKIFKRATAIRKKIFTRRSIEYVESLCQLAKATILSSCYEIGSYQLSRAERINKKYLDNNPSIALEIQSIRGHTRIIPLKYENDQWIQAGEMAEKYFKNILKHTEMLSILATHHQHTGNTNMAESCLLEILDIYKEKGLTDQYWRKTLALGNVYARNGKYKESISTLLAIPQPEKRFPKDTYLTYLTALAKSYTYSGQYSLAEEAIKKAFLLMENKIDPMSSLNCVRGEFYMETGQFEKAKEIFLDRKSREKKFILIGDMVYENSLYNLGKIAEKEGNYHEAYEYYHKHLKRTHRYYESPYFTATSLNLIINILNVVREVEPGKLTEENLLALLDELKLVFGGNSIFCVYQLETIGDYYNSLKEYSKAYSFYHEGWKLLLENSNNEEYRIYNTLAEKIALLKEIEEKPEEASEYYSKALRSTQNSTQNTFSFLPAAEQEVFLASRKETFNNIKSFAYRNKEILHSTAIAYDTELFHKNLLLSSITQLQNSIIISDDEYLLKSWTKLKLLKEKQARNYLSQIYIDNQLEEDILKLEREIIQKSNQYQDYQEKTPGWEEIRNALQENEVAIEFSFINPNKELSGEIRYYALLLRANDSYPQLIPLCSESDLQQALSMPYEANTLYSLVWKPIEKELTHIDRVYMAPTGLLHHVAFNALKDSGNEYLIDKYHIQHVLSTKDILSLKEDPQIIDTPQSIALFGGPDYDLHFKDMIVLDPDLLQKPDKDVTRSLSDFFDRGQGFSYLQNAKAEVDSIGKIFRDLGWITNVYTDMEATETRFKSLSSQSPSVIHIATHGYYYPSAIKNKTQKNIYKISENPLVRSGLLFTGANNRWLSKEIPDDIEDGILCAYEISTLNLTNTQLVVLSACNTGKGDIINNEGTYGLQRAFRLAGVQSLIITLWDVNDRVTQNFMITFYKKWITGLPLREAFQLTQKEFSKTHEDNIKKWAGFVLIE